MHDAHGDLVAQDQADLGALGKPGRQLCLAIEIDPPLGAGGERQEIATGFLIGQVGEDQAQGARQEQKEPHPGITIQRSADQFASAWVGQSGGEYKRAVRVARGQSSEYPVNLPTKTPPARTPWTGLMDTNDE